MMIIRFNLKGGLNGKKDGEWKYFKKDGSINKIEKWMLGKKHRK